MPQEDILARYAILQELAREPIGASYVARDRSTGAEVALKTLDPALFNTPGGDSAANLLKDVYAAGRLRHRNILKMHDAGEAGGTAYIATEIPEGQSLRQILDGGPLPISRALQIFDDIACALAYAHEEGVVHGGLRPSSIFVATSGVAKLGDFGIGRVGEQALVTLQRAGPVGYLSPEQVRGEQVDHRADLFALGAVFYEMLTRRAPFEGGSSKEIMQNILQAGPKAPSEVNPHVPRALDQMVFSLLARRPEDRLANGRVLLRELQRLEEALGLRPAAPVEATRPPPTRQPAAVAQHATPLAQHDVPIPDEAVFDHQKAMLLMDREYARERSSGSRSTILSALALLLALIAIGLAAMMYYSTDSSEANTPPSPPPPVAEAIKEPTPAPSVPPPPPPRVQADEPAPATPPVADASASAHTDAPDSRASKEKEPAVARTAPAQEPRRATQPAATPAPQPGATARLILTVSPRAEVYIDGKHYGTTPPTTTFELEPGMHRIEVRSGSRKPFLAYMTVQAGEVRRIRHDFDAKPVRPPG